MCQAAVGCSRPRARLREVRAFEQLRYRATRALAASAQAPASGLADDPMESLQAHLSSAAVQLLPAKRQRLALPTLQLGCAQAPAADVAPPDFIVFAHLRFYVVLGGLRLLRRTLALPVLNMWSIIFKD